MNRTFLAALALATSTLAAAPSADADCAALGLAPKVLTPNNAILSNAIGGIVVAAVVKQQGGLQAGDVAIQTNWRFKDDLRTAPKFTSLAPGLAVINVPQGKVVELLDSNGASLVKVQAAGEEQRKSAPAPKIKRLAFHGTPPPSYHGSEQVTVELDGTLPADTVAIILYDTTGPKSFGVATGSATLLGYSHPDCEALPNGTRPSRAGDTVTIRLVFKDGTISMPSAATKIVAAPPTKL